MFLHIGHKDIGLRVEDFQTLAGETMESRDDLLSRVGDEATTGTEAEIDAAWNAEFTEFAVLIQDGTTVFTAHIHHRQLWILIGKGVTVHAAVLQLFVVAESIRLEILYATLLNLYIVPDFVIRLDETISKIRINLICYDLPVEWSVLNPLPVRQGCNSHFNTLSNRLFHEFFPIVDVEDCFVTFGINDDRTGSYLYSIIFTT